MDSSKKRPADIKKLDSDDAFLHPQGASSSDPSPARIISGHEAMQRYKEQDEQKAKAEGETSQAQPPSL